MCGGNKGAQQKTTVNTPNPAVAATGTQALGMAGQNATLGVPQAPVAQFSPDQLRAFEAARSNYGMAMPYFNAATNYATQGGSPITPEMVSANYNPYAQNVFANMEETFGQQNRNALGKLIQGAGGTNADRIAVAQAEMARQQGLAKGQVASNMWQQAYQNAAGNRQAAANAAYTFGQLGPAAEAALRGDVNQLYGFGGQQQALAQAMLMSPYNAYMMQTYGIPQWLAGITGGLSGAMGGTQTTTTKPPPWWNQALGAGLGLAGAGQQMGLFGGGGGGGGVPDYQAGDWVAAGQGEGPWAAGADGGRVEGYQTGGQVGRYVNPYAVTGTASVSPFQIPPNFNANPIQLPTSASYGPSGQPVINPPSPPPVSPDMFNQPLSGLPMTGPFSRMLQQFPQFQWNQLPNTMSGFPDLSNAQAGQAGMPGTTGVPPTSGTNLPATQQFQEGGEVGSDFDVKSMFGDTWSKSPYFGQPVQSHWGGPSGSGGGDGGSKSSGGFGDVMKTAGDIAKIAMMFARRGGRINRQNGGGIGSFGLSDLLKKPKSDEDSENNIPMGGLIDVARGQGIPLGGLIDVIGGGGIGGLIPRAEGGAVTPFSMYQGYQEGGETPPPWPFQDVSPQAMNAWRQGVDTDRGLGQTATSFQPTSPEPGIAPSPFTRANPNVSPPPVVQQAPPSYQPPPPPYPRNIGANVNTSGIPLMMAGAAAAQSYGGLGAGIAAGFGGYGKGLQEQREQGMKEQNVNEAANKLIQDWKKHTTMTPLEAARMGQISAQEARANAQAAKDRFIVEPRTDGSTYIFDRQTHKSILLAPGEEPPPAWKALLNQTQGVGPSSTPGGIPSAQPPQQPQEAAPEKPKAKEDALVEYSSEPQGIPYEYTKSGKTVLPDKSLVSIDSTYGMLSPKQAGPMAQKEWADLIKSHRTESQGAQDATTKLNQMMVEIDKTGNGFLALGKWANERNALVDFNNSAKRIAGMPPTFEAEQAALAALNKLNTQLGFSLSRTLGAREALQIVQAAMAASPGPQLSPEANRIVMAGLYADTQKKIDKYKFLESFRGKYPYSPTQAEAWFGKLYPEDRYTKLYKVRSTAGEVKTEEDLAAAKEGRSYRHWDEKNNQWNIFVYNPLTKKWNVRPL